MFRFRKKTKQNKEGLGFKAKKQGCRKKAKQKIKE